tara:strand:+ start:2464 stop:2643 length:180 start_codon:yes stop_codon:yes gene_type:complete
MSKRNIERNNSDRNKTKRFNNFRKSEFDMGKNKFGFREQINIYWQKRNSERLRYKNRFK